MAAGVFPTKYRLQGRVRCGLAHARGRKEGDWNRTASIIVFQCHPYKLHVQFKYIQTEALKRVHRLFLDIYVHFI